MNKEPLSRLERFVNILFFLFTILLVLLAIAFIINSTNKFVGFIILSIYIILYFFNKENKNKILKLFYVEREQYNLILNELLKLQNKNGENK